MTDRETFVKIYDEHFSLQYGFWRPYVEQVTNRYLDCGDLHNGFAWVKCKDYNTSTYRNSPASTTISALPAIRSTWWN